MLPKVPEGDRAFDYDVAVVATAAVHVTAAFVATCTAVLLLFCLVLTLMNAIDIWPWT